MNPTPELESLIAQRVAATTERERARLEAEIWALSPKNERTAGGSRKWLVSVLMTHDPTVRTRDMGGRQLLHNAGDLSDVLWQRIDGAEQMTVHSASVLLREARRSAGINDSDVRDELVKQLQAYDKMPSYKLPNGRTYRKQPRALGSKRSEWGSLRSAIARIVDNELRHVCDAGLRGRLKGQIDVEISSLIRILTHRVQRAKESASLDQSPTKVSDRKRRQDLRDACQLLSVDAPPPGQPVPFLTYQKAKKNYRALVKEYHPDASGTEDTRDRYQAVIDAMLVIEQNFQNDISATTTSDKDISNG